MARTVTLNNICVVTLFSAVVFATGISEWILYWHQTSSVKVRHSYPQESADGVRVSVCE